MNIFYTFVGICTNTLENFFKINRLVDDNESINLNNLRADLELKEITDIDSIYSAYLTDRQKNIENLPVEEPHSSKFEKLKFNNQITDEDITFLKLINFDVGKFYCHFIYIGETLSNILQNVFKPGQFDWVDEYIKYFEEITENSTDAVGYNNIIITYFTKIHAEEWLFCKIICHDSSTVDRLRIMSDEIIIFEQLYSPKLYIVKIYEYFFEKMHNINLFVVFMEYLKIIKLLPQNHMFYYQIQGIATHIFSRLTFIGKQRRKHTAGLFLKEDSFDQLRDMFKSVSMIYLTVRYINSFAYLDTERMKKVKFMLCSCVVDPSKKNSRHVLRALDISLYVKKRFQAINLSSHGEAYLKYFVSYVVPFSMYSPRYIEGLLWSIYSKNYQKFDDLRILDKMKEYFDITQFIHSN